MDLSSLHPNEEARLNSLRLIHTKCMALVGAAHDCFSKAKSLRRLAVRRREVQERCAGFARASYPRIAEFMAANAALAFAYILDLLLVGVIAEYFAAQRFPNSPAMAAVAPSSSRSVTPASAEGTMTSGPL